MSIYAIVLFVPTGAEAAARLRLRKLSSAAPTTKGLVSWALPDDPIREARRLLLSE
jgi:hypothetical protein